MQNATVENIRVMFTEEMSDKFTLEEKMRLEEREQN